jgi:tRNA C32,U32 (ribose-2'-O)-methylase TrmJ
VQIISYECRLASQSLNDNNQANPDHVISELKKSSDTLVSSADMDGYFEQLETVLIETKFLNPEKPRYLMPKLRRLYSRTSVTRSKLNILRGILSAFQKNKKNT